MLYMNMDMDMDMDMDQESRGLRAQKQYLENVLENVTEQRNYIIRTKPGLLNAYYDDFLYDFDDTQKNVEYASLTMTRSIEHLIEIEDLRKQINMTINESRKILNEKAGNTTLQSLVRTSILKNRPYFDKLIDIDYKEKDIENKYDSKKKGKRKTRRRMKKYPIRDILERIGNEEPGTTDDYNYYTEDEFDPYTYDPLLGTSTHPLTRNPPPPLPPPRSTGGRLINSRNIYRKRKTKKNKRNKTKSNKKK
jgi:hypothetical protein